MWKDPDGNIVTKKPTLPTDVQKTQLLPQSSSQLEDPTQQLFDFAPFAHQEDGAPISPPISNNSLTHSWDDHDSGLGTAYPPIHDPATLPSADLYTSIDHFWSTDLAQPQHQLQPDPIATTVFDDAPFDDIFNPDTASSFNNPFTTMSNYNWLFDMDLSRPDQIQESHTQDQLSAIAFNNHATAQDNHVFDIQMEPLDFDKPKSSANQFGTSSLQYASSARHHSLGAPIFVSTLSEKQQQINTNIAQQPQREAEDIQAPPTRTAQTLQQGPLRGVERPMSMLQPSRGLPIIDELARAQVLDLVDITQPTAPDGSIVMRDHPLLTLKCLQTYCDLFFTRFNTAYPLIHMSTFDPSEIDTLLLFSVMLLGATYGEKDAHQLAVSRPRSLR
jgi:hypothetical protein